MVNKEILDYVSSELSRGITAETIRQNLTTAGWTTVDIEEAFSQISSAQTGSRPNKKPKKTLTKLTKLMITIIGLGVGLLVLGFILKFFSSPQSPQTTISQNQNLSVVDAQTQEPISDALVTYTTWDFNGCATEQQTVTNNTGEALIPDKPICGVEVSKEGYHTNGVHHVSKTNATWKQVTLHRIQEPQSYLEFTRVFTNESPSLNVMALAHNIDPQTSPEDFISETDNPDFTFTVIDNEAKEFNAVGQSILRMRFYGEGGVQEISDAPQSSAGESYHDMENLLIAPATGYAQELDIKDGKSYIAKLADGKRYFKFHVFATKRRDGLGAINYACLRGYVQTEPSTNIEFVDIFDPPPCFWDGVSLASKGQLDTSTSDYADKEKYLRIKEIISGEHEITRVQFYQNTVSLFTNWNHDTEDVLNYYFVPMSKDLDGLEDADSPANFRDLEGKTVTVEIVPFDIFKAYMFQKDELPFHKWSTSETPVYLYLDGKFLDPGDVLNNF